MPLHSIIAGVFGAFASVFGKLAFSSDSIAVKYISQTCHANLKISSELYCSYIIYGFRALMFFIMMTVNGIMLSSMVRALHSDGSLKSTVITTSVNFVATAIFAYLLFSEDLSMTWWVGAFFIFLGVYFVQKGKVVIDENTVAVESARKKKSD